MRGEGGISWLPRAFNPFQENAWVSLLSLSLNRRARVRTPGLPLGTAPPSLSPSLPLDPGAAGQVATHPLLQLESAFSVPTAPLRLKPATHTCHDSPLVRLAAFPPPDGPITLSGRTVGPHAAPPPGRSSGACGLDGSGGWG